MAPPKGWKPTPEQKKHMGDSHRGFKHTEETCKIYSESKKGEKNPMYGTHHTDEWKKDMSIKLKGKPKSEETKKRMKEAQNKIKAPHVGQKHTQEAKDKMSKNRMGMKFSEEHKQHLSEAHIGQTVSIEERKRRSEYNKAHPEVFEQLRYTRTKRPSGPQLKLFKIIKNLYPEHVVEPEWKVNTKEGIRYIDVAIPSLMRGFEFDGKYWHPDKEKDMVRHRLIEAEGWTLEHYSELSDLSKIEKK